jgi:hypothetical protein
MGPQISLNLWKNLSLATNLEACNLLAALFIFLFLYKIIFAMFFEGAQKN